MKNLSKSEVENKLNLLSENWVVKDNMLFAKFKFTTFDDAFDFMKLVSEKCFPKKRHEKCLWKAALSKSVFFKSQNRKNTVQYPTLTKTS